MWTTFPSIDTYHIQLISILVTAIIAWIYLIRRLWPFKRVPKSTKTTWTFVMIFVFSQTTTLYYIWAKDDQLSHENKELEMTKETVTT